jgi:hypothetical protein
MEMTSRIFAENGYERNETLGESQPVSEKSYVE